MLGAVVTRDRGERSRSLRAAVKYLAATAGCALASLVNPYTYRLHQHVIEYVRDPYQSTHIMEFLSVSFHHPIAIFF